MLSKLKCRFYEFSDAMIFCVYCRWWRDTIDCAIVDTFYVEHLSILSDKSRKQGHFQHSPSRRILGTWDKMSRVGTASSRRYGDQI